ncbi:MAG: hypothetical protein QXK45_05650 [Thermofilaceae archaeon]
MILREYRDNNMELVIEEIGDRIYIFRGYSDDMSFNIVFYDDKGGSIDDVIDRIKTRFNILGVFDRLRKENDYLGI